MNVTRKVELGTGVDLKFVETSEGLLVNIVVDRHLSNPFNQINSVWLNGLESQSLMNQLAQYSVWRGEQVANGNTSVVDSNINES